MRSRQVACLGSCVYSLTCTLTYTSSFTPDMLVCLRVLGTAVLWGRPWGWGARAAGARAPGRPPGPRWPALVWAFGGRAAASARAAWPGARRAFLGALARGSSARMLAAHHSGSVGPDTPPSSLTSANPGFITRTAISLRPAGYFVIHRSGSWRES